MIQILDTKIPVSIGAFILVIAMIMDLLITSVPIVQKTVTQTEAMEQSRLQLILVQSGEDLSVENMDNWNYYSNDAYGFKIKYPPSENTPKETYSENSPQALEVKFDKFIIRIWENSDDLAPEDYISSEPFCDLNKSFCASPANKKDPAFKKVKIGELEFFQGDERGRRLFMPAPDGKYLVDFESTTASSAYAKKFYKIISTFEFN